MASHRRVKPTSVECLSVSPPFSNFEYFENHFLDLPSVRRLFSLARSFGMQTLVIEDIPARGIIKNENEEIKKYVKDYRMDGLKRLSFWQAQFKQPRSLNSRQSEEVIGYAILKHDVAPSRNVNKWHVFEAVFRKYQHKHNCVPNPKEYTFVIGESDLSVPGVLYCQQNGLNKACAQVALRSLLSRRPSIKDISYEEINGLAACVPRASSFDPSEGLNVPQIRSVLEGFGVSFFDIDYTNQTNEFRETHPYQKYLYAGVESGAGALLGFLLSGPLAKNHERHIIPFYGHTFNKDTWAPDADVSYFNIGADIGYFPSDSWTSSFLGHDDNFGPNFCVPRLYIRPNKADYVVELLSDSVAYSGVHAEAISLHFLYSLLSKIQKPSNEWLKRLIKWVKEQKVVLRTLSVSKEIFSEHLRKIRDWEGSQENFEIIDLFKKFLPNMLWVIEISLPHLFPANERKVGEIVLDATVLFNPNKPIDFRTFVLSRVPGKYFFLKSVSKGSPIFLDIPSSIKSHVPLLVLANERSGRQK